MKKLDQDIQRARACLGGNVERARKAEGLSRDELATRLGVTPQRVADIEAGAYDVPIDTLAHLARGLHLSLSELFE